MTGSFAAGAFAGTHTFSVKQSSLPPESRKFMSPKTFPCMQCEPNSVALRPPSHFAGATGGFQRRSPTGGAAYGIPRNTRTAPSTLPSAIPEAVFTCGPSAAPNRASGKANNPHTTNVPRTIFEFMRSPSTWNENSELYRKKSQGVGWPLPRKSPLKNLQSEA